MTDLIVVLERIAEELIKREHREIDKDMTLEQKARFYNAHVTISEHAQHIAKTV